MPARLEPARPSVLLRSRQATASVSGRSQAAPSTISPRMRITFLGHAGLHVDTRHGSILCDPWFNPAFLASWFPFPSNEGIDPDSIGSPDYLYVSHLHQDHFDKRFLEEHVDKDATVLLPDFPTDHLRRALEDLGFRRFAQTRNREPFDLDGMQVMINALVTPTDGPIGDSGLAVDDGSTRIFDQNDSRPVDMDALIDFGPYDAHFLQFSGGIWYPMAYRFSEQTKRALGRAKRANELARAARFAKDLGASHVFPCAGPPCFLDDELVSFNDFDRDESNIFPDQTVFLEHLESEGLTNGHLMMPGTLIELGEAAGAHDHAAQPQACGDEALSDAGRVRAGGSARGDRGAPLSIVHPMEDAEIARIFSDKRSYIEGYRRRKKPYIEWVKASWPRGEVDVPAALKEWWEPLLLDADHTCAGVNGRVLLDIGDDAVVVDFLDRRVDRWKGEECRFRFWFDRGPVEKCVLDHEEDWINALFLSCRFEAERDGSYNEYVYTFFKSLSPERMRYVESYYAQRPPLHELWECDGYLVQRRCPHLEGDLTRFARVDDGVLTCQLHGWQFDLATGRCLTSDDRRLYTRPLEAPAERPRGAGSGQPAP
jgi:UDP-MurNAc hydroxylase